MSDPDRDVMEYDLVVVGAGPAGLACALRYREHMPEASICVLEKGSELGAHSLSGAVMQPDALDELIPDWRASFSEAVPAGRETFRFMTRRRSWWLPVPPQMHNRDNFILSLGSLVRFLGERAESAGVDVFPGFPAREALIENGRVVGVRCQDMGMDSDGTVGPNFSAGVDIRTPMTVLAEGCRGNVSKTLISEFGLDEGADPQTYGLGMKELWQLPEGRGEAGSITHTVGWPLDGASYGGSFIYHLGDNQAYVGFVVGLDYPDPDFSPFEAFQQFKHHPDIRALLECGEIISAGARSIVEGGWQSIPRMEMPGALLVGDAAGLLDVPKIKGIHQALRAGMLAGDHLATHSDGRGFDAALRRSQAGRDLRKVRNIRPGFRFGFWIGMLNAALETVTFGKLPWTLTNHHDHTALRPRDATRPVDRGWVERDLAPRDRLASVYFAATSHEETQPAHLHVADPDICVSRCTEEFGNPCTRFCPANVYEIVEEAEGPRLQVNAANCVHCKACDIKDPYELITWVTPEGGAGPNYRKL